ncbi:MAG: carbohydrate-binding domain-containing protein [Oscillospiraceae bacterium]|jgi:hypothetical protein|nr:carbohydrate-binding domain-containing protein [Oscillospiraceae bacterium]
MKRTIAFLAALLVLTFGVAGCSKGDSEGSTDPTVTNQSNTTTAATTPAQNVSITEKAKEVDTDSTWDTVTATITLNGDAASVSGEGAKASGGTVTISAAGTYVVSGTLHAGQILIAAGEKDDVRLVLNGVNITADKNAALYAATANKLVLILAEGTTNTLTDGASYDYADAEKEEPDAALFSKCDLSINGTGALTVNGNYKHGVATKDDLIIASGNITVNAVATALRGKDTITVLGGAFHLTSQQGDGIKSANDAETDKGWILIKGGAFTIAAHNDGIQAATALQIDDGKFTVTAGEGALSASADESFKGIKAGGNIDLNGGTFNVTTYDDSIHSNADITIADGAFTLASGDDGIHADATLTVKGGEINVTKSYEGLEGANVNIIGGKITVLSTDDGINAAGGTNANVGGGRYGNDQFAGGSATGITISGGVITLYTTSDGIDSNGTLEITGGTVAIFIGTTRDGDATDVDNGGTILPALYGATSIAAGTKLAVDDLWSLTLASNVTSYCLILPGVVAGQSYQITANGAALATVTATTTIQGMMGGGNAGGMGGRGGRR